MCNYIQCTYCHKLGHKANRSLAQTIMIRKLVIRIEMLLQIVEVSKKIIQKLKYALFIKAQTEKLYCLYFMIQS